MGKKRIKVPFFILNIPFIICFNKGTVTVPTVDRSCVTRDAESRVCTAVYFLMEYTRHTHALDAVLFVITPFTALVICLQGL
jgi:hypothetical protein